MARDRVIACVNYLNEGNCAKGKKGTFWSYCQTCTKYEAKRGSAPARKDLRQEKKEKFEKNWRNWM